MPSKKILKTCKHCENEYMGIFKSKFCSQKCSNDSKKTKVSCLNCSKDVYKAKSKILNNTFCSHNCYVEYKKDNNTKEKSDCEYCNKEFFYYPKVQVGKYCSRECSDKAPNKKGIESKIYKKIEIKCDYCSKLFTRKPSEIKNQNNNFCSQKCYWDSSNCYGRKHAKYITLKCDKCSKELRRTESNIKNKKKIFCSKKCAGLVDVEMETKSCSTCSKEINKSKSYFKNNKYKNYYCTEKCRNIGRNGENNPRYNPLLTDNDRIRNRSSQEYSEWRFSVFKRDYFKCQVCTSKSKNINAHHIENYSSIKEKRFDVDNGVTLCVGCHRDFHSKYGVVRNNKIQFEEFKSLYTIES